MVEAVLFDLDGVLVDTRELVATALTAVATDALGTPPSAQAVAAVLPLPPVDALAALGVPDPAAAFDNGFDLAFTAHAAQARTNHAALDAIRELAEAKVALGLVTLQRRNRLPLLLTTDLLDLFGITVTYTDAAPKPAPDGITLALDTLGVPGSRTWFIGDTPTDMTAARAAGVTAVGAAWGYTDRDTLRRAGAHLVLSEPAQIITIVLAEGASTMRYDSSAHRTAEPMNGADQPGGDLTRTGYDTG